MSPGSALRMLGALALISLLAALAGCGSSERPASTQARLTRSTVHEPTLADGPHYDYKTHGEVVEAVQKTVAECKAAVTSSNQITAAEKDELSGVCNEGYTGHEPFQVYVVSKAVCEELALLIPDKSKQAKERAFATCYARARRWR